MGVAAVVWSPIRTLRSVAEGRSALPGLLVVAACAVLGLVVSTTFVLSGATRRQLEQQQPTQPGLPPGFWDAFTRTVEVGVPALAALSPFLLWIPVALFMHVVTRFFGGMGPFSAMLGVVGVAQVPFLVSGALSFLVSSPQLFAAVPQQIVAAVGYAANLFGLASLVWYAVLVVIGVALARNIGYGESAGSCAISCVGLAVLIIVVGLIVSLGAFAAVSAA